jgi:hypothetical protein
VKITASASDVARAYEALRAQAVGHTPTATPRGLALFLRVGLAGWMPACAPLTPSPAPPRAGENGHGPGRAVALDGELVRVLVEMALRGQRRCRA